MAQMLLLNLEPGLEFIQFRKFSCSVVSRL